MISLTPRARRLLLARALPATFWLAATMGPLSAQQSPPAPAPLQQPAAPAAAPPPSSPPASAPVLAAMPAEVGEALQRLSVDMDRSEQAAERLKAHEDDLSRLRGTVEQLQEEAQRIADLIQPKLQILRSQIEKLGPPPGKDQPAEAATLAAERARLSALSLEADAAIKKCELIQLRGRQLINHVQQLRHHIFARDLMRRTYSPLSIATWREIAGETAVAGRELGEIAASWWGRARPRLGLFVGVIVLSVLAFVLLHKSVTAAISRRVRPPVDQTPSFFVRAGTAGVIAPALALPGIAGASLAYLGLDGLELLGLQVSRFAETLLASAIIFTAVSALAVAILEPRHPRWRLIELTDESAHRLERLALAASGVYAADLVVQDTVSALYLALPVGAVTTFISSVAIALLLVAVVHTPFGKPAVSLGDHKGLPPRAGSSVYHPRWLKLPLLAVAAAIIVAALLGFVALSRFLATQVLLSGSGIVLLMLLYHAARALAALPTEAEHPMAQALQSRLGLDAGRRGQISTALSVLLLALLGLVGAPLLLLTWGFSLAEILGWMRALVFGFEVGQFRISLARLLIAAGIFIALVFATRLVQRWLGQSVLPGAKLDSGLANSLTTGLGYIGFGLATLAAVSYAGLDVTNIAIVAGALSVGIGFGLQSIVNNFVSGLILLVERPIKVGDWVVLKDREGIVRRISVRATEIETFDRASLIVPNAELVTGPLLNWTHRNSIGRVIIRISVSYQSDPDQVRRELMAIAEANKGVLSHPPPLVSFDNFGQHGFEFSLRVFLADVMQSLVVQTELRSEIVKVFRNRGIDMPYPQLDLLVHGLGDRAAAAVTLDAARKAGA
jgi:small-conductance mechanosensitive channel